MDELKKKLAKQLGMANRVLTDDELKEVLAEIEKHSVEKRTKTLWQQIIKSKTGFNLFLICESLDMSDVNYLHKQILDLLKKK